MATDATREHHSVSRWLPALLVFIWPFVYYYRCLVPGQSFSLAIGNDFDVLYYNYKVYLLDLLASGHFPLWSPSEAAGFPFYSSPFTQVFYPLNLPLAAFYSIMGGYSVFDGQAFTILGLAIYGLGLYAWLKVLVPNTRAVLFATLIVGVSFKLGDILRFPNAVHAAAWMPWILYGITLAAAKGCHFKGAAIVFLSSVMLLTAGYPYYVYYCLFLVPPYLLMLLWPACRAALSPASQAWPVKGKALITAMVAAGFAAHLIASPYLYKMSQLLAQTVDRGSGSYEYATLHEFFLGDTLGSLIFPPIAQTEGWYYFGVLGTLLLVLYAAGALYERSRRPLDVRFLLIAFLWMAVITYVTYGRHSYLFDLLWNYVPGFSRLRVWSRLNIVLLPILALCLARAYAYLEGILERPQDSERQQLLRALLGALIAVSAMILAVQSLLLGWHSSNLYWRLHFGHVAGREVYFVAATVGAFILLAATLGLAWRGRAFGRTLRVVFLVLCLAISLADLRPIGAMQWLSPASPDMGVRKRLNMEGAIARSLNVPRVREEDSTIALSDRFNVGYLINWYFDRYLSFENRVFSNEYFARVIDRREFPQFRKLLGMVDGRRLFFSRGLAHPTIRSFLEDAEKTEGEIKPGLLVVQYDGDRLIAEVRTPEPLYLSFIDNWDPDWVAEVNGRPAPIERLFGTFKAVMLPAGESTLVLAYRPWSF